MANSTVIPRSPAIAGRRGIFLNEGLVKTKYIDLKNFVAGKILHPDPIGIQDDILLIAKNGCMKRIFKKIFFIPRMPVLFLIKIYQKTLSPDHGWFKSQFPHGYCRFHPTCSQYGYEVIKKRGLIVGVPKALWRIMRCNPWGKGGIDLPK